jgi:hypothetical protein
LASETEKDDVKEALGAGIVPSKPHHVGEGPIRLLYRNRYRYRNGSGRYFFSIDRDGAGRASHYCGFGVDDEEG